MEGYTQWGPLGATQGKKGQVRATQGQDCVLPARHHCRPTHLPPCPPAAICIATHGPRLSPTPVLTPHKNPQVVAPSEPREKRGLYWGYTTRLAKGVAGLVRDSPFPEGYDLKVCAGAQAWGASGSEELRTCV